MKLTEQEKQSITDYYRYERNCTPFVFPSEMNPYIEQFCKDNDILVFDIPKDDWFPDIIRTRLEFAGADASRHSVLIRRYKFEHVDMKFMEVAMLHEIGHNMSKNPYNEEDADKFAIMKLRELYGIEEGTKIYLRWLFKQVNLDKETEKFTPEPTGYTHRNDIVETCIANGLDRYADCFE